MRPVDQLGVCLELWEEEQEPPQAYAEVPGVLNQVLGHEQLDIPLLRHLVAGLVPPALDVGIDRYLENTAGSSRAGDEVHYGAAAFGPDPLAGLVCDRDFHDDSSDQLYLQLRCLRRQKGSHSDGAAVLHQKLVPRVNRGGMHQRPLPDQCGQLSVQEGENGTVEAFYGNPS